ncbi:MAG: DUF1653 domain-containing protein [Lachnotalea sp.]
MLKKEHSFYEDIALNMEREVKPGEFYKHFKNKVYQIVAIATHSETREKMVVYQALYGDFQTYIRPYAMFISEVDQDKYPDVKQKYRFAKYDVNTGGIINEDSSINNEKLTQNNFPKEIDQALAQVDTKNINMNEEEQISPLLLAFLDCTTYEAKLDQLVSMKNMLNERLLNDIAMSLDIIVESTKSEDQYNEIKACLLTFVHFEDNRVR